MKYSVYMDWTLLVSNWEAIYQNKEDLSFIRLSIVNNQMSKHYGTHATVKLYQENLSQGYEVKVLIYSKPCQNELEVDDCIENIKVNWQTIVDSARMVSLL